MPDLILAGDIGGTNVRLRLLDGETIVCEETVARRPVVDVVAAFRQSRMAQAPAAAAFGCAGGVKDGRAHFVARKNEQISEPLLAEALGLPLERVRLVNDMTAHMGGLDDCEFVTLRAGEPHGLVEAMVMPGTGLGCGLRVDAGGRWIPIGTEGGQVDAAPVDWYDDFFAFAARRHGVDRLTWEHVAAGPSLSLLYEWQGFEGNVPPEQIVAWAGEEDGEGVACHAVEMFLSLAGQRAGNLCLTTSATRGVWLAGGLLNAIHVACSDKFAHFEDAFTRCGPDVLRDYLAAVPLRLLTTSDSGLRGAAALARAMLA